MSDYRKLEPGMDDEQAQTDRHGWRTSVDFVTGKGMLVEAMSAGGPEVGNQFDTDPLGEEYSAITYPASVAMPPGKIGGGSSGPPVT